MNKIEYIKKIEDKDLIFSVLETSYSLNTIEKLDKNSNLKLVYTESNFRDGNLEYDSKLFKSEIGFYIYVKKIKTEILKYELTIYHLPSQLNEIIIFLKYINK